MSLIVPFILLIILISIPSLIYVTVHSMKNDATTHISSRDLFLHFLAMFTLYFSAISMTVLLFNLIDLYIADPTDSAYWYGVGSRYESAIRTALSFLVVMFPVCLVTLRKVQRMYAAHAKKAKTKVRKAIAYFTLFVTTFIFLFTVVITINQFLDGELSLRFGLKILSAFAILGSVYWYYRWDLDAYKKLTGDDE